MTNKEFQNILAQYPDDYEICMDNVFGWEDKHNLIDPHLFINTDIGQIEIEPDKYRDIWVNPKDRLPEDGQECIISLGIHLDGSSMNELTNYSKVGRMFHYWDSVNDCIGSYDPEDIMAWMPIPEPYEETIKDKE